MPTIPPARDVPNRRDWLRAGALGLAGGTLASSRPPIAMAEEASPEPAADLTVERIDRTTVKLPYREVPARNMARELPHWRYFEVFEVRLACGAVGIGETMLFYTWGVSRDDDVERAEGRNAAALMWDDSLGAGLQMALFDAVARALGVPIHRLLGPKVHDRTPLSWWDIELSPEDLASECAEAHRRGYTAFKTKGRPWFDVFAQVREAAGVVPESFKIDIDFNDTLLDAERAIPILTELEKIPQVGIYETPIPQRDIAGNRAIRAATRVPIAMHYGNPDPIVALRQDVCDGFVVGGGARRVSRAGAVAAMADKPFWLQLVGSGITAAYSLHFGGVLSHATWPAVNCHQLFADDLLAEPIPVEGGTAAVPDGPGLGVAIDLEKLERYRVEKPPERPEPERLIETTWPDGTRMYIANTGEVNFMITYANRELIPYFREGTTTRLLPDDDSDRWRNLYDRAREGPVIIRD